MSEVLDFTWGQCDVKHASGTCQPNSDNHAVLLYPGPLAGAVHAIELHVEGFITFRAALDGLQVGQKLEAVVELDKDDYLVLSFPERPGVVGSAATSDLNLQTQRSFSVGQKLQATVVALPSDSTGTISSLQHRPCCLLQGSTCVSFRCAPDDWRNACSWSYCCQI